MKTISKQIKFTNNIRGWFVYKFNISYIGLETDKNRYWIIFRDSLNINIKGKFTLKFMKTENDHTYCGS